MSARKPSCVIHDLFGVRETFCRISSVSNQEDDSTFKLFWISVSSVQIFLDLLKNLSRCQSWENDSTRTRLVLHRFHIILCLRWTVGSLEIDLSILHLLVCARTSFLDTKMNLSRRVLLLSPTFTLLCSKVDHIQWVKCHSFGDTFRISASCSKINLCVMSNNVLSSSKWVFLYTSNFFIVLWSKMN